MEGGVCMIIVTNTNDSGAGSLRAAIAAAGVGEEITFATTGIISLTSGELLITQDLIITGPGPDMLVLDGGGLSRVFNTNVGVIAISGLSIINGQGSQGGGIHNESTLTLNNVEIDSCVSTDEGGGIWNSSTVTLTDCTIVGCVAAAGNGGGINNTGTITATDLNVDTCSASGNGGGVYNDFGTHTQIGGRISECTTTSGHGGGLYNTGTATLTEAAIFSNDAGGNGDGIFANFATTTLTRCAVYGNDQLNIQSNASTLTIANSTISGLGTVLSAIQMETGSALIVSNSTITQHGSGIHATSGSAISLYDTIIAGNDGNDIDAFTADVTSLGNNILGVDSNEPITEASGDQRVLTYAALMVGPMQDNGGATFTHALLEDSPAVDAGNNIDAPDTDQRGTGFTRIFNTTIDIGAFEFQGSEPEPPGPEPEPPEPEPPTPTPTSAGATSIGDCRRVSCCNATGEQFSDFTYSLVSGQTYTNNEFTLIVPCPRGYDCTADSVTIVLPPGRVKFTPTTISGNPPKAGDPWDPLSGTYEFNCGNQVLTITATGAFTQAQIDAIVDFLSRCQANQDAIAELQPKPVFTPSGKPGIRLWNTEQSYTAECPEGETGDPVTVTIPAKTHSSIILATSTPLQQYLAQQALDQFTLAEATAQAEAALDCQPAAQCPELKSTFLPFSPSRTSAAVYGLTQNLTYFSMDEPGVGFRMVGIDDADAAALDVLFAGDEARFSSGCFSELHNALYVGCVLGGVGGGGTPIIRVLSAATLTVITDIDVSAFSSSPGRLTYFESIDMVAAVFDSNYIALIDGATNTISAVVSPGIPTQQDVELAYVPSNGRIYCPTDFTAPPQITIRDLALAVVGAINLPALSIISGIILVPTDGVILVEKLVTASFDGEWIIKIIDPATDSIISNVPTGIVISSGRTAITYDSALHLAYLFLSDSLVVFDVINETVLCTVAQAANFDCRQIALNTTTGSFYLPSAALSVSIRKYGQPPP